MGSHRFDPDRADRLDDVSRFAYLSVDELLALFDADGDDVVADLGSGTGFYTDEVAPYVETLYAVDVQAAMHDHYRERGMPDTVVAVTAEAADLPFADDDLSAIFSTMTYHEFASEAALAELARVLEPGGRIAIGDWTSEGRGEGGPPLADRFAAADARSALASAGFEVRRAEDRRETFVCAARLP